MNYLLIFLIIINKNCFDAQAANAIIDKPVIDFLVLASGGQVIFAGIAGADKAVNKPSSCGKYQLTVIRPAASAASASFSAVKLAVITAEELVAIYLEDE